jgi:Mrp family chromosome partitioning ATPase
MESPEWATYRNPLDPNAKKDFVESMEAGVVPNTFLVRVSFTDKDPARAQAAVKAVINSYLLAYKDEDSYDLQEKDRVVNGIISDVSKQRANLEDQLQKQLNQVDTPEVRELHVRELMMLKEQLNQANLQLDSAKKAIATSKGPAGDPGQAQQNAAGGDGGADLGYAQLAKYDGRIPTYLAKRDEAADKLARYKARFGPNHPMIQEAEKEFDAAQARLDGVAEDARSLAAQQPSAGQVMTDGVTSTPITPQTIAVLESRAKALTAMIAEGEKKLNGTSAASATIQSLQAQIKDMDNKLVDANATKEQLRVRGAMSGRIIVRSLGDKPVVPAIDRRRQAAILGFLGGGSIPFVLFMLVGLADKRYRYSDETKTEMGNVPLLGILPNLPDLLTDPQQAAIAAHCVHQIRTLLQVGVRTHDRHVYAITSAAPGDGKTSLTLALGLSFAASGSRTLLIDCDLVGGSLTRRLGVHSAEGMLEAMGSRSPMDFVRDTDVNDLSILPVGSATMLSAGSFSPAGLRRLIAEARKSFDIVLIDTGPILGSIEAPPVAATADATILCVSRGQQRPAVERSMHHLIAIGAKMAGIVFNRAEARDFEKSVSRFSQRSIRSSDYRANGNGNGTGLHLPGGGIGGIKTDPDAKASAAAGGVDPVTRAVASDFKGDNGHDPR